MKIIALYALLMLLSACSSSPSPVLPPAGLTKIEQNLDVSRQWRKLVGKGVGVGDFYLKLKPVVNGSTGYVADHTGYISSFNIKTGDKNWDTDLGDKISAGLAYHKGNLYLANADGQVVVLNAKTSELIWKQQLSSEILSSPVVSGGIVVVRTIDGKVYGLDEDSGNISWSYFRTVPRLTLRGASQPVISNDMVVIAFDNGKLSALTLKTGKLLWEATVATPQGRNELERVIDLDVDPVIDNDVVYVAGYQGSLAAVSLTSGRIIWNRDFSSYSGLSVDAYRLYITDATGHVWALNRYNGSTLWRQDKLLRRKLTAPVTYNDFVVVGDFDGYLHFLSRTEGNIVARYKMNSSGFGSESSEESVETYQFSKPNNILVAPVKVDDMLLSYDRSGHLEAYKVEKN